MIHVYLDGEKTPLSEEVGAKLHEKMLVELKEHVKKYGLSIPFSPTIPMSINMGEVDDRT